jgi:GH35 family endo-1,4-beta-xylanase
MLSKYWKQIAHIRIGVILAGLCIGFLAGTQSAAAQPATSGTATWLRCNSNGRSDSIGINVNNIGFPGLKSGAVIEALDQSAVGWVRINIYWGWTEQQRGAFNWQVIDDGLDRLEAAHVTPLVTITGPVPCWALGGPKGCKDARNTTPPAAEWTSFVRTVVTRYKQRVHYWEIWNEPDLAPSNDEPDPTRRLEEYRDNILIPGAQAVHSVDPTAKVAGPTFAGIPAGHTGMGPDLRRALLTVLKGRGADLIDIVTFHSYFPEDINAKAIEVRDVMKELGIGQKPIWITETGLGPQHLGMAAKVQGRNYVLGQQSKFLQEQTFTVLSHGNAQKVFWFSLTAPSNAQDDYGLIDAPGGTWRPRPAFSMLQSLVTSSCGGKSNPTKANHVP